MKQRCYNKNCLHYKNYGERGIIVCESWKASFENFLEDIGLRPGLGYSLDRIDNNGNYCKENCKWSTQKEQMNNLRKSMIIIYKGIKYTPNKIMEIFGINNRTVIYRRRAGWTDEEIIETPVDNNRQKHIFVYNDIIYTVAEASIKFNIPAVSIRYQKRNGLTDEEIINKYKTLPTTHL